MKHFQLALFLLSLAFLILTIIVKFNPTLAIDLAITRGVQSIQGTFFNRIMVYLSLLGYFPASIVLVALGVVGLYFLKLKKEACLLLISTTGAYFISVFLKALIERPRPNANVINQMGVFTKPDSFPSGHVLFYISLFGYLIYLSYINLKPGLLRSILVTTCAILILLIGLSRIYLGAHWFSDVLGSYLIGTIWLSVVLYLHHHLKQKAR